MSMLRSKLYEFELEKKREVTKKIEDSKLDIDFGSQIRSYVLQPYRMIKDHRTKLEIGDVDRVLESLPHLHRLQELCRNRPETGTVGAELHVEGPIQPDTGWFIDYADLKRAFQPLHDVLDHNYLNEIEGLDNPTSENLPVWILLGGFGIYATLRAFEGDFFSWGPYLSAVLATTADLVLYTPIFKNAWMLPRKENATAYGRCPPGA